MYGGVLLAEDSQPLSTRRSQQRATTEGHNRRPQQKATPEGHNRRPHQKATSEGQSEGHNKGYLPLGLGVSTSGSRGLSASGSRVGGWWLLGVGRGVRLWVWGVCLWAQGVLYLWVSGVSASESGVSTKPPFHHTTRYPRVDRQTPVKTLPCPKLRLREVIITHILSLAFYLK